MVLRGTALSAALLLSGCAIGGLPARVAAPPSAVPTADAGTTATSPPTDSNANGSLGAAADSGAASGAEAPRPVPAKVSAASAAKGVAVRGRYGRLTAAQREALIKRIGAQGGASDLNRHVLAMARFDEVDLHAHNEATLLIDGPRTFAAMFEAIEQARSSVLLQSYIIEDAAVSKRLADLLQRKRAEGVAVAVLYDGVGSIRAPKAFLESLTAAGIPSCAFHPLNPLERPGYWDLTHRDHRKILVVDRSVGFTGGINISAVYSSGSFGRARVRNGEQRDTRTGWRDTQIRLRGPAAVPLDDLVRKTWQTQGCRGALPPAATALAPPAGAQSLVRIVPSSPKDDESRIYAMLLNAIDTATTSIYLTMAYFAPGRDMVDALADAARRGVDVRLVLPSVSDFAPVLHAGRSHYSRLLDAGVRLYELDDAVLHAKTAVIDGVVSTVGSSNMDWRSFAGNDEVNAVVFGEPFGTAMVEVFNRDIARSTAITPQAWSQRPWLQRGKEGLARLFERWW